MSLIFSIAGLIFACCSIFGLFMTKRSYDKRLKCAHSTIHDLQGRHAREEERGDELRRELRNIVTDNMRLEVALKKQDEKPEKEKVVQNTILTPNKGRMLMLGGTNEREDNL